MTVELTARQYLDRVYEQFTESQTNVASLHP